LVRGGLIGGWEWEWEWGWIVVGVGWEWGWVVVGECVFGVVGVVEVGVEIVRFVFVGCIG